jgi:hypothetical protein
MPHFLETLTRGQRQKEVKLWCAIIASIEATVKMSVGFFTLIFGQWDQSGRVADRRSDRSDKGDIAHNQRRGTQLKRKVKGLSPTEPSPTRLLKPIDNSLYIRCNI